MVPLFPDQEFAAFLFDMDGTLLTSVEASRRVWGSWAQRFGLDAATFLPKAHGMRVSEVIAALQLPGVDPEREADHILAGELADLGDVRAVAGAAAFLSTLPADRYAIVTSAPRSLATRRLEAAGLPIPPVLIAAEDVRVGKPDPTCFVMAAQRLGVAPERCLIFEDAPAGVAAAIAAGAQVVTITAAHRHAELADHVALPDYRGVRATASEPHGPWTILREAD